MYFVEVVGDKLSAWVNYGDDFPLSIAMYEDEAMTTPKDLTGKEYVLGIETSQGTSVCEIDGIISGNEVNFPINYSVYSLTEIAEGKKYKFDYWNKTDRLTEIPKSDLEFRSVAHKTEG